MRRLSILVNRMLLYGVLIAATCFTAIAEAATFTWDLSKSLPALAGQGTSFTADAIDTTTYLTGVAQANGTAFRQVLRVTGFRLNGQPVTASELNSGYGLYFDIIGATEVTAGGPRYTNLNLSLLADPGNNDGILSATSVAGPTFSNGTSGDFVLASGTLIAASLSMDAAGIHAQYVMSFAPASEEFGFFGLPLPLLDAALTTPLADFRVIPQPDGTALDLVSGGTGQVTFEAAPEPSSLALLGGGLLAFFLFSRGGWRSCVPCKSEAHATQDCNPLARILHI